MSAADLLLHPLCVIEAAGEKCLWCKLTKARYQTKELMIALLAVTDAFERLPGVPTPEIEGARALLARLGKSLGAWRTRRSRTS